MQIVKYLPLLILILLFGMSCSGKSGNPIVDDFQESANDSGIENMPIIEFDGSSAIGLFGAYNLAINPDNSVDLVSMRSSSIGESYIVSGKAFFAMTPCHDCLKIENVSLDVYGNIVLGLSVKHPFPKGDSSKPPTATNRLDLDVFDLALVVAPSDEVADIFPLTGASACPGIIINADGYTKELSNVISTDEVMPYKICYESETNNRFEMGFDNQPFDLVVSPGSGVSFDLYLTMGYGESAKRPTRLLPEYYVPEFNRKAAWKVVVTPPEGGDPPGIGNTWSNTDTSTNFAVSIDIYDWNHGATIAADYPDTENRDQIMADSSVGEVTVEVPGMTSAIVTATTTDTTSNGWDDPLTFIASFANENGLSLGEYFGLVKVTDTRVVGGSIVGGETDTLIHTDDGIILQWFELDEFATYQTFTATVVTGASIELINPNGGEIFGIGSTPDITWSTTDYTGMIKLEYSKDGFFSDIHEIIASTDDDGTYEWDVPNDPSTTVRVRASLASAPSVYDDSDADFEISDVSFTLVLDESYSVNQSFRDRGPSIITKANGDVFMAWAYERTTVGFYSSGCHYSTDSGENWIDQGSGGWSGSFLETPPLITCMALDALGDAYYKIHRPIHSNNSLIVRFSSQLPRSGVCLTGAEHGIALVFTHDGYPIEFGDWGGSIKYKKGQDQNTPHSDGWMGWETTTQYTAVSNAHLSQTRNILKDSSDAIYFCYFSNVSDTWIRMAYNVDTNGLNWNTGNDIYDGASDGYDSAREPSLLLDDDGDWHSVFILHTNTPSSTESIAYTRSTDGLNWDAPLTVYDIPGVDILDWANVQTVEVASTEIVTVTFSENNRIYLTYSWNEGQSWEIPTALSAGTTDNYPDMCVTSDGYIHNVWEHDLGADIIIEYIRAHYEVN